MTTRPTIRSLAQSLGLSVATVSEALRDSPRVRAGTKARVVRAAAEAGYRGNPLLGAALSAVRRGRHQQYRGTLALVGAVESNPELYARFHREIAAGAEARAQELGFQTELFRLGEQEPALTHRRLQAVLAARGIEGAVLLPFHTARDMGDFDFARLAAVQMDHSLILPHLHTVLPDHYLSLHHALGELRRRGYQRIGLCLEDRKDERVKRKWSGAYLAYFRERADASALPPLLAPRLTRDSFLTWHRRHRPDVIIGHVQAIVDWLTESGCAVPDQTGFLNLNLTERTAPCAGLDLGPRRLGAVAIETVVAMLHRYERGIPASPQTISLGAAWSEGPTLRRLAPVAETARGIS
jgi:DNA-binding LacI/PurR family transcriptional regulator